MSEESASKRKSEEMSVAEPTKVFFSFDIESRGDDLLKHGMLAIGWCVGAIDEDRVLEKGRLCLKPLVIVPDGAISDMVDLAEHGSLPCTFSPPSALQTQGMDPKCLEEFWYSEEKCPGGRAKLEELMVQAIDAGDAMRQFRAVLDKWDDGEKYKAVIISDNIVFDGGWVDYYLSRFGLSRIHLTPQGKYRRVYDTVDYRRGLVKMDYGDRWLNEQGIIKRYGLTVDPSAHTHMPEEDAEYIYRFHQQLVAKAAIAYDEEQPVEKKFTEGPYTKDHPVIALIKEKLTDSAADECMGFTYEAGDHYTLMWFKTLESATDAQKQINAMVGWDMATKPGLVTADDAWNPFTLDVVGFNLLPYDSVQAGMVKK